MALNRSLNLFESRFPHLPNEDNVPFAHTGLPPLLPLPKKSIYGFPAALYYVHIVDGQKRCKGWFLGTWVKNSFISELLRAPWARGHQFLEHLRTEAALRRQQAVEESRGAGIGTLWVTLGDS